MRTLWLSVIALNALTAAACAPAATQPQSQIGMSIGPGTPDDPPAKAPVKKRVPDDVVARHAQPFRAQRNADAAAIDQNRLYDELARFDVVCLGEAHDEPRDHYAELAITEALERRARVSGRALGVGFEMFADRYNAQLYAYSVGKLDDAGLQKKTRYEENWGFPYAYYRPVLNLGKTYGLPLKPLNAPSELTRAVAKDGLAKLTPRLRRQLPELDLGDDEHRQVFDKMMASHPHGESEDFSMDNFYAAQVVWDETMADNAATWVADRAPSRQLVVLAGSAHCRNEAIPSRIERRQALRVTNVRLSASEPADSEGYDYTLVFDGK